MKLVFKFLYYISKFFERFFSNLSYKLYLFYIEFSPEEKEIIRNILEAPDTFNHPYYNKERLERLREVYYGSSFNDEEFFIVPDEILKSKIMTGDVSHD